MLVEMEIYEAARNYGRALAETLKKKNTKSTSIIDIFSAVSSTQDLLEAMEKTMKTITVNNGYPSGSKTILDNINNFTNEKSTAVARIIAAEAYRWLATKTFINASNENAVGDAE